jgi:polygalacturonase
LRLHSLPLPWLPLVLAIAVHSSASSDSTNPAHLRPPVHDVSKYGAKGDGKTNDHDALQEAIDACKGTGGSVYLHGGKFLTGQITLGSDMTLFIAPSATLLGIQSTNQSDYPSKKADTLNRNNGACQKRLIWGEGLKNVTITGGGTIDGQGDFLPWRSQKTKIPESLRPSLLGIARSENVAVSNLTILRPGMWTQVYLECRGLILRKLKVETGNLPSNRDGMDICDCHDVLIEDCDIKAQDDGICFKSGGAFGCKDIAVRHCSIDKLGLGAGNCVKFGTASYGSFINVLCQDLFVQNTGNTAFTWESVDGAVIQNVEVRDCVISNAAQPISLILGERRSSIEGLQRRIGSVSNVVFKNITSISSVSPVACLVTGSPGNPVHDIHFSGLKLRFSGGSKSVPPAPTEYQGGYPEGTHFGEFPGYAFYVRHADGVTFTNCEFSTEKPDTRPWLATEDVRALRHNGIKLPGER